MSLAKIPSRIMLSLIGEDGYKWTGHVPLERFERLTKEYIDIEYTSDDAEKQVFLELQVSQDSRSTDIYRIVIDGATQIPQVCQRCLQAFSQPLYVVVDLALLVKNEAEVLLSDDEDFLYLQDTDSYDDKKGLNIISVIEDELLLSLPISPKHDDCQMVVDTVGEIAEEEETVESPFAALASLKGKL